MVTLTPEGAVAPEAQLSGWEVELAQRFLSDSPYHGLRSVVCQRRGDRLLLCGRVESFLLKQMAQETVRSAVPEQAITNLLTVD